jgi:hypothetical protein
VVSGWSYEWGVEGLVISLRACGHQLDLMHYFPLFKSVVRAPFASLLKKNHQGEQDKGPDREKASEIINNMRSTNE